jgi:hypothetical protein
MNSKERRHSGRVTPVSVWGMKKNDIIENCLEPQEYWDDWKDYRDGFRGYDDRKMLRNPFMFNAEGFDVRRWNKKIRRLLLIRKARKEKQRLMKDIFLNNVIQIHEKNFS